MRNMDELLHLDELEWGNTEAAELQTLLENPHIKKALAIVYQGVMEKRNHLINRNLEDPEERAMATKTQGEIHGVEEFLEQLIDLATEQEQDDGH